MTDLIEELTAKARALPRAERVRLTEDLLSTVQESDDEIDAAWDAEIQRRIAEIDAGTAKLIPAAEAFEQARRLLK